MGRKGKVHPEAEYSVSSEDHSTDSSDDGKHGPRRSFDEDFSGPVETRSCRDIPVCLLFILFLIGMIVVSSQGFLIGRPERLLYGVDTYGNMCNFDNTHRAGGIDMTGREFLFYGNPSDPGQIKICVATCPNSLAEIGDILATTPAAKVTGGNASSIICDSKFEALGVEPTFGDIWLPGRNSVNFTYPCYLRYPTKPIVRRCVPSLSENATKAVMDHLQDSAETSKIILTDVYTTRFVILACCGLALVFSFVWVLLLRFLAGCMVWTTVLFMIILSCLVTALLCVRTKEAMEYKDATDKEGTTTDQQTINLRLLQAFSVTAIVLTLCFFIFICCMANNIRLAVEIMEEASKCLTAQPSMVFFPLPMFGVYAVFLVYWVVAWIWLGTAGEDVWDSQGRHSIEVSREIRGLQGYHVFGLLWVTQFILAIGMTTIAGATAGWYFTRDKDNDLPMAPTVRSLGRVLRYSLGSMAFGSLIIAIVQFIRLLIFYLQRNLELAKENRLVAFILKCLACIFACAERFLKFISRNAYITISIYGESFCSAAKDAYGLLQRNALRVMTIQAIGDALMFLGKMVITLATGLCAFFYLKDDPDLEFFFMPVLVIVVLAYIIAAGFMSVYEMTIDTIFLCFCEDCERNSGDDQEYFMDEDLVKFTESKKKNKQTDLAN